MITRQDKSLRIAGECRGDQLQGFDGDRGVKFGGTLLKLYDAGDKTFVLLEADGMKAQGYDQGTSTFYAASVADGLVQIYDHGESAWFTYDIQDPEAPQSYHRKVCVNL